MCTTIGYWLFYVITVKHFVAMSEVQPLLSKKSISNIISEFRSILREKGMDPHSYIPRQQWYERPQKSPKKRERAPCNPSKEQLIAILLAKHDSFNTWAKFAASRNHYEVYQSKVHYLEKRLVANVAGVHLFQRGAFLNPGMALGIYLEMAFRDKLCHHGQYQRSLCIFLDANHMDPYPFDKCHLLAFSLPEVRQPHQLAAIQPIGRWLGPDNSCALWRIFTMINMVAVLVAAKNGSYGEPMRIKWCPDWGAYTAICNWVGPGQEMACVACHAPKTYWKLPRNRKFPKRRLEHYQTPFKEFLTLFEVEEDIVYCIAHNWALVCTHLFIHGCYLWMQQYMPARVPYLLAVYRKHLDACPYKPPLSEGTHRKDWKLSCNHAKQLLFSDSFWDDMAWVLPRTCDGLATTNPMNPDGLQTIDPFHLFLKELRRLGLQLFSWTPANVSTRTQDCDALHVLYYEIGLPQKRFTVAFHYFLCHYQERLERHGNLMGLSTKGGEHTHQPHKSIIHARPGYPKWKCPMGLYCCMLHAALQLAFWVEGIRHPKNAAQHQISLLGN